MNDMKEKLIEALLAEERNRDSIEIGNSKTGTMKVYFDSSNPAEAEKKLENALELLKKYRNEVLGGI